MSESKYYIPVRIYGWDNDHYGEYTSEADCDTIEEARELQSVLKSLEFTEEWKGKMTWEFGGSLLHQELTEYLIVKIKEETKRLKGEEREKYLEIRRYLKDKIHLDETGGIFESDFRIHKRTIFDEEVE